MTDPPPSIKQFQNGADSLECNKITLEKGKKCFSHKTFSAISYFPTKSASLHKNSKDKNEAKAWKNLPQWKN
jgi:hypothetical protein